MVTRAAMSFIFKIYKRDPSRCDYLGSISLGKSLKVANGSSY